MNRISIEVIAVGDLADFESEYRSQPGPKWVTPITPTRAQAQARNPLAARDDPGLLLARSDQGIVGHLSVLPGEFWTGKEDLAILWSNAFYVHPDFRNTLAAFLLLKKLTKLQRDVFVTGFNVPSREICSAAGFEDLHSLRYDKLDLRFLDPIRSMGNKFRRFSGKKRVNPARASRYYAPVRRLSLGWIRRKLQAMMQGGRWESIDSIDAPPARSDCRPHFRRSPATINWVIQNPWLRESGVPCAPEYHFSDIRNLFRYEAVGLFGPQQDDVGFAVFSVTERRGTRTLKLLDHDAPSSAAVATLLDAAFDLTLQYQIDQLILPENATTPIRRLRGLSRQFVTKHREYQWKPVSRGRTLVDIIGSSAKIQLQLQDGDCGFG